jgi:hypothetical protein
MSYRISRNLTLNKYKYKLSELSSQRGSGQKMCQSVESLTHILIHGVCLDGSMTSYLLQKYCNIPEDKIRYIAPGNNILYTVDTIINEGGEPKIGLYDLALPEISNDTLRDYPIKKIVDHHISTYNFSANQIVNYKSDYATCGIVWLDLFDTIITAPLFLRVINKGDRGILSLDNDIEEFIIYIGLQKILDVYASNKKNTWKKVGKLINYLIIYELNFLNLIKFIGTVEILRKYYYIRQYTHKCYVTTIFDTIRVIYIPKTRHDTIISQVSGKMVKGVDYVIIYPNYVTDSPAPPRLTIRGVSDSSNANDLAKRINPNDGGGHIKASSVGVTYEYINNIEKTVMDLKNQCTHDTVDNDNYLPNFTDTQVDLLNNLLTTKASNNHLDPIELLKDAVNVNYNDVLKINAIRNRKIADIIQLKFNIDTILKKNNNEYSYVTEIINIINNALSIKITPYQWYEPAMTRSVLKPGSSLNPNSPVFTPGSLNRNSPVFTPGSPLKPIHPSLSPTSPTSQPFHQSLSPTSPYRPSSTKLVTNQPFHQSLSPTSPTSPSSTKLVTNQSLSPTSPYRPSSTKLVTNQQLRPKKPRSHIPSIIN